MASAPVLLGLSCLILPVLAARDPLEQDTLSIEARPRGASVKLAVNRSAGVKVAPNLGGITKDSSSTAQSLGAAITALTNPGISIESSEVQVQDSFVEETADVHRAVAQLLGIVDGDLCPHVAQGQKHGCHLGCRCGILQRCFSKPYVGLGAGITASNSSSDEAHGRVDVGICRMSDPALMAVLAAVSLTVFIGMLLLRQLRADPAALGDRAALESRLRSTTALSAEQREAILDEFCGDEIKPGLNQGLKEPNFTSVAALPMKSIDGDERTERVAGTGGTAGYDSSDTSDTD
mmetsp:Transcript_160068/g.292195  ORF Transcript_160068/g.292195 Transcript_160068/m.292195 type:complete len:292 (-) Transcript_160068:102-977(-)